MVSQDSFISVNINDTNNSYSLEDFKTKNCLFSFRENANVTIVNRMKGYTLLVENELSDDLEIIKFGNEYQLNSRQSTKATLSYAIILKNNKTHLEIRNSYLVTRLKGIDNDEAYHKMIKTIYDANHSLLFDIKKSKLNDKAFYSRKQPSTTLRTLDLIIHKQQLIIAYLKKTIIAINRYKNVLINSKKVKKITPKTIVRSVTHSSYNGKMFSYWNIKTTDFENINKYYNMILIIKQALDKNIANINQIININTERLGVLRDNFILQSASWMEDEKELIKIENSNLLDVNISLGFILKSVCYVINNLFDFGVKKDTFYPTRTFLLNKNFKYLYENLYLPLLETQPFSKLSIGKLRTMSLHTTSKLFEIYSLIKLDNDIKKIGYFCLSKDIQCYESYSVSSPIIRRYIKNGKLLILMYDHTAKPIKTESNAYSDIYYVTSHHISPDFSIILLDEKGLPIYFAVMDAKCKSASKMYRTTFQKDEERHCIATDYLYLKYINANDTYINGKSVDNLIFFCPKIDADYDRTIDGYGIRYINIKTDNSTDKLTEILEAKLASSQ